MNNILRNGKIVIRQPRVAIVNAYTAIAVVYCTIFSIIFLVELKNLFLCLVHAGALIGVVANYYLLLRTKNFNRATNVILTIGTVVVVSLFATGGWDNTGYLWPFAYLPFAFFLSTSTRQTTFWIIALFASCLLVTLLHILNVVTIPYSPAALFNYFAALVVFVACILLFQRATIRYEEFLSYTGNLLELAPDAVIVIGEEGKILRWNSKSEIIFGWKAEEVLGKYLSEVIIPERYRDAHRNGLKYFLQTKKGPVLGKTIEVHALRKDDSEFNIALSISPAFVNDKYQFIGFVRDITEQKILEEKVKQANINLEAQVELKTQEVVLSEKKYRHLFHDNPMPMWVIDSVDYRFLDVNEAAIKHYGYSREDFLSMTALDMRPQEERIKFTEFNRSNERGLRNTGTWKHLKKDGTIIQAEVIRNEITLEGEKALLILSNDVTEKAIAEKKLAKYTADLERSNKELEQFAYVASHDLQEPLRMVGSYMQLLERRYKDKLDDDAKEFIFYAVDGANRMKQLINDLLNYSRTNREGKLTDVNINEIINEVLLNLKAKIDETGTWFIIGDMPIIEADRMQMLQLFQNLIANAIKFRKESEKPLININVAKQDDGWLFSIADNGIGISKEYADQVFVIFKRLHDKSKYEGTGIGLAIVRKIVERHNGKIWFESEADAGTTFYFTLNVKKEETD